MPPALEIELGRTTPEAYRRFKCLLNRARHPTFVGPEMVKRRAREGGLFFFRERGGDADCATALVNARNSSLLVLSVPRDRQGQGIGRAVMEYLRPNFVRTTDAAKPWFARLGYVALGEPRRGRTLDTWVMVRGDLIPLAGRVARRLQARAPQAEAPGGADGAAKPPGGAQ